MLISGWDKKYTEISREFNFDKRNDLESAIILDMILRNSNRNPRHEWELWVEIINCTTPPEFSKDNCD